MGIAQGLIDTSKLNSDDYIVGNNVLWFKADVEEKIVITDVIKGGDPEACVIIKLGHACEPTIDKDQAFTTPTLLALITALQTPQAPKKKEEGGDPDNKEKRKAKNFCGIDDELKALLKKQKQSDKKAENNLGFQPAAIIPAAAAIPMKSNILVYGPYASSNFGSSAGGTKVEVETDLAPWIYGSVNAMNTAGQSMVQAGSIGLTRAETGDLTVPGLPNMSSLGFALSGGPVLSNINLNLSSGGITTQYSFKTYTPKFGSLNRHFLDRFKSIAKNRRESIKLLRNNQIVQNKINLRIRQNAGGGDDNQPKPAADKKSSLQILMMGQLLSDEFYTDTQVTKVGTIPMFDSRVEMGKDEYKNKAFMSLDGLFGPVSLYGDGELPRYAYTNPNGHKASPILPHPPFKKDNPCSTSDITHDEFNIDINQKYLNPLTNKFKNGEHYHSGDGDGHVIDMVGREYEVPESGIITNFYKPDDDKRYSKDYRFLGMRGPLVLHSWGYDLEGKPVPNGADREDRAKQGLFESSKLKDEFLDDWLRKPATWPVAPVDLRFDRNRGVWVSPQPYKIIVAKIVEAVEPFNNGKAIIIPYGKPLFTQDEQQVTVPSPSISCETGYKQVSQWILSSIGALPGECGLDVITGLSLENGCLVATRKRVTVMSYTDLEPVTIQTASCETTPSSSSGSGTPNAPTSLTATCGDSSISLSWTDPSSTSIPAIDGYVIFYRKRDPLNPNAAWASKQATPCAAGKMIGGLINGIEYEVRVAAKNSNGTGAYSDTVTATPCGGCVVAEPTPQPATPSSTEVAFIKIVDRIGRYLRVDDLVYAYYDTSTEEYIALEQNPVAATPTIYGTYSPVSCSEGYFTVKYAAGLDSSDSIGADTVIMVKNPLGFRLSTSNCAVPAIAIKMDKL